MKLMSSWFFFSSLLGLLLCQASCGSAPGLTREQMNKLHPSLQLLLEQGRAAEGMLDVSTRTDGEKEYGVIIRCKNSADVRSAGITIGSVMGELVTARVTRQELERVARIPSVIFVEPSTPNYPIQ